MGKHTRKFAKWWLKSRRWHFSPTWSTSLIQFSSFQCLFLLHFCTEQLHRHNCWKREVGAGERHSAHGRIQGEEARGTGRATRPERARPRARLAQPRRLTRTAPPASREGQCPVRHKGPSGQGSGSSCEHTHAATVPSSCHAVMQAFTALRLGYRALQTGARPGPRTADRNDGSSEDAAA